MLRPIQFSGTNKAPTVKDFPEGASQSFKQGEVVVVNTDGLLVVCASSATLAAGIATQKATGTQGSPIAVQLFDKDCVLEGSIYQSNAPTTLSVIAQTDVGPSGEANTGYGLVVVSNKPYINKYDTTNKMFQVIGIELMNEKIDDLYQKVYFKVIDTFRQYA